MDTLENIWDSIQDAVPGYVVGAVAVLIVGWFVAWLLSKVVAGALRKTGLSQRLAGITGGDGAQSDAAGTIGRMVFYLVMLFVVIAVLDRLQLRLATEPLNNMLSGLFAFIPNLIGAGILAVLAWIIARILRTVVFQLARTARLDERLRAGSGTEPEPATAAPSQSPPANPGPRSALAATAPPAGAERFPLSNGLAEVAYALVFLLFLPAILDALQLNGLLEPVNELLNKVFGFIPNLIAAGLILVIGWFIARFVSRLVASVLAAIGIDRLSERFGLATALGNQRLSGILGMVVYILILIPVIVAGLNALQLPALTEPASEMLNTLLSVIPKVIAAAAILIIMYAIGRVVAQLVTGLLAGTAFDRLPERLGVTATQGAAPGGWVPSRLTGTLVLAVFMWFGVIEALEVLELDVMTGLLTSLLQLAGRIFLGLVIIAIGVWLARLAARAIRGSSAQQANLLAFAAQAAVLVLFGAMGLRQMGVANEIINVGFTVLIGAIGIAVAVAFGVGGRGVAGQLLDRWVSQAQSGDLDRAARRAMDSGPAPESGSPIA